MSEKIITANQLKSMIAVGCDRLKAGADYVDSLNVFPVPDGDTGTNMNLSFSAGLDRVNQSDGQTVEAVSEALAKGLLMGARGNSGVILSQIFRGFSKACQGKEELDAKAFAACLTSGVKTAYKAVMKPVEGTILTVAREASEAAEECAKNTKDVIEVMKAANQAANQALENTPNLLPVLKEVGVVDSGGQGLCFIYAGFLESLTGEAVPAYRQELSQANLSELAHEENYYKTSHSVSSEDIKYGFCTEIMVRLAEKGKAEEDFDYETFRNYLNERGNSLLVVNDDEVVKVHVHTEHPGDVLNYGQRFGTLIKIKVDNMRLQHDNILENKAKPKEKKDYGIIAVAVGEGVQTMLKELGATSIINGGQTMNPSTEDFIKAIEEGNAQKVILLPNNKNIFLAAKQAAEVSEIPTVVVASRFITQGLSALLAFDPDQDLESNQEAMTQAMEDVKSGQITHAIRDTSLNGVEIHEGDFMGIVDGDILISDQGLENVTLQTIDAMQDEESELLTVIYGEDVQPEEAEALRTKLSERYEDLEIEMYEGKQPIYNYLLSVE